MHARMVLVRAGRYGLDEVDFAERRGDGLIRPRHSSLASARSQGAACQIVLHAPKGKSRILIDFSLHLEYDIIDLLCAYQG